MDSFGKCDSPRGSSMDSLITKVRMEITNSTEDDLVKKISIQAANKPQENCGSKCDIDKKISDLECLIRRLQDELNDISKANKPCEDQCGLDICIPVECIPEEPEICCPTEYSVEIKDECFTEVKHDKPCEYISNDMEKPWDSPSNPPSNRYPIILRDIDHVQKQEKDDICNETGEDKETNESNIICEDKEQIREDLYEDTSNLEQNISRDWEKERCEKKEKDYPNVDSDSVTAMIRELRAEINDTIHSLNENEFAPCKSKH